ncbi:hypothetical protein [Ekhidna sp.]|uniref:hypothetical protein n=1 Tax=Ekhidna sp. TaxID=2608089 RepID=UPI00351204D5
MKTALIIILFSLFQTQVTVVKNNGDQVVLKNIKVYQSEGQSSSDALIYSYRGEDSNISFKEVKRISVKETLQKKKGVTTYRVILVKSNNDKLEVDIDLIKLEGTNENGKVESMNLSSVDKISF